MITNPLDAKQPIATRPVSSTTPIQHQPRITALRFGSGKDTATTTTSLPEWTKKVKDPKVTMSQVKASSGTLKSMSNLGRLLKDALADHDEYLPEQCRKDLKKYHRTPTYWFTRIFKPSKAKLMNTVYRGPIAIKLKQNAVSALPELKNTRQQIKELSKFLKWYQKPAVKILELLQYIQIKNIEGYAPLLNRVPPLPNSKFEKQLQALQKKYNASHSDNPIETIEKDPIGTGSIGQVYKGVTKNGQKVVLKVIKPDITPQYLDEYLPLLYYNAMLITGTTLQDKQKAVAAAKETVHILKDEIQPEKEARNSRLMQQWAKQLGIKKFQVPDVLASTDSGLITPFVGEKDVADLKDAEKNNLKVKLAPDLARLLVLSPAKPLDLHEGNMRTGNTPYWIDHGRQINLNEAAHQSLMKLMISTYKAPQNSVRPNNFAEHALWDNALLQTDTRANLKALLQLNPTANKTLLTRLENMDAKIREKQKGSKAPADLNYNDIVSNPDFNALKVQLSQLLGQPIPIDEQQKRKSLSRAKNDVIADHTNPSILNAWASCALSLPGFTETQLPQHDVNQYKKKSSGFLVPYVQDVDAKSESKSTTTSMFGEQKLTEKQKSQLKNLADSLADGLLAQTKSTPITTIEREQLTKNIQKALNKDLLPKYSE